MGSFSLIHWVILAVLILLLFGGSRFSNMMGDVAKGLKSFKKGMTDEDESKPEQRPDPRQIGQNQQQSGQAPIDITPRPADPVAPPPPVDDQTR